MPSYRKFCSSCNRIRLTAKGDIKPCLCFADGFDLREILRNADVQNRHEKLIGIIRTAIKAKPEGHSFGDEKLVSEYHRMFEIGG